MKERKRISADTFANVLRVFSFAGLGVSFAFGNTNGLLFYGVLAITASMLLLELRMMESTMLYFTLFRMAERGIPDGEAERSDAADQPGV